MFPLARRELARWRALALAIPDVELRRHALATHRAKAEHSEGAAAFAVLAPRRGRCDVVRALIAFQAMYDYLDTLSEQPGCDPLTNGWRLHAALVAAVDATEPERDYYALHSHGDDGGYLQALISTCRDACASLPSFEVVAAAARSAAVRAMESQGYHHALTLGSPPLPSSVAERWAARLCPDDEFFWWEVLGAAGSSLAILALMAVAGKPQLRPADCDAIDHLYFPWAGALLGLMDSLVDQVGDESSGQHSLTARYPSRTEAADRLRHIATCSLERSRQLPDGHRHALILAAMTSFFATEAGASAPDARMGARVALAALGAHAALPLAALRLRRCVGRLRWPRSAGP